jgi:CheY-like chemotaxis protein
MKNNEKNTQNNQEDIKIKILCVEDEREIRENIAEILRDEGFEVFEGENGKIGFELFLQHKPDIVMSDVMMPEADGYKLLEMIRGSKNRNNNVPFIFLTALGQRENIIKGVSLSANDYLTKPVDFDLMIAKVKEKTINSLKLQESQNQDIDNIKNQISTILPNQAIQNIDQIITIIDNLKKEPYGPLPHRRYLEDINMIAVNINRLKASIVNSLDSQTIDNRLNLNEEIFDISKFLSDCISQSPVASDIVKINKDYISDNLPQVKLDKQHFGELLNKMLEALILDNKSLSIEINIMIDHLEQMAIIFYIRNGDNVNLDKFFADKVLSEQFERQHCHIKYSNQDNKNIIIFIPNYRLNS